MSIRSPRLKGILNKWSLLLATLLVPGTVMAEYGLNFQEPVTEIASDLLELHNLILIIVTVIFIIVFGFMFYSIFAHRKSRGAKAAKFDENSTLEVIWTIIPFVILVGMAVPSTKVLLKMDDVSGSDMTVNIIGYQWKWKYEYPDNGISFFSNLSSSRDQIENKAEKGEHYLLEVDNPMVVPVGKKVRMVLTSNDVLHAWWVPQLGVKKDAIPGYVNEMWTTIDKPGIYRGQCAELCGKDHAYMPIVVKAVSESEFKRWASVQKDKQVAAAASATKKWSKADLMKRGQQVYMQSCAACHQAGGQGIPGAFPAITGSKIALGPVKGHLDIVMNGKSGTAMTAFKGQLNDADIAAVVTYQRNGLGNSVGDVVQPSQAKAAR